MLAYKYLRRIAPFIIVLTVCQNLLNNYSLHNAPLSVFNYNYSNIICTICQLFSSYTQLILKKEFFFKYSTKQALKLYSHKILLNPNKKISIMLTITLINISFC